MFTSSPALASAFSLLLSRPAQLTLTTGEMFPTERKVEETGEMAVMEGVEHLGQYVFEMTKAKVEAIKRGEGALPPVSLGRAEDGEGEEEEAEDMDDGDADGDVEME